MTERRFVERYAGRRLIGIEDIETNRVCVTIEENIRLLNELSDENKQLKQRINSRLHFYRGLYESTNDKIVKRVIEDLEDILKR